MTYIFLIPGVGCFFVVYDKCTQTFWDVAILDTCGNNGIDHLLKYDQTVKSFFATHFGVLPVFYSIPNNFTIPYTQNEQMIMNSGITFSYILENSDTHISALSKYYDKEGLEEVLTTPDSYFDYNGIKRMEDKVGKYVNIVAGHRVTEFQPVHAENCIYIMGDCRIFGIGSTD